MTTPTEPRVFSETEAAAIIADRVAKETSALTDNIATLTTANADLATKLDVAEAAKVAAEKAAADAVAEFEAFKTKITEDAEKAAKKDERLKVLTEAASLDESFLADEDRVARIVAKSDEDFADYVDAIKAVAAKKAPETDAEKLARETAAAGKQITPPGDEPKIHPGLAFLTPALANTEVK